MRFSLFTAAAFLSASCHLVSAAPTSSNAPVKRWLTSTAGVFCDIYNGRYASDGDIETSIQNMNNLDSTGSLTVSAGPGHCIKVPGAVNTANILLCNDETYEISLVNWLVAEAVAALFEITECDNGGFFNGQAFSQGGPNFNFIIAGY